jgi:hypothetical protein
MAAGHFGRGPHSRKGRKGNLYIPASKPKVVPFFARLASLREKVLAVSIWCSSSRSSRLGGKQFLPRKKLIHT